MDFSINTKRKPVLTLIIILFFILSFYSYANGATPPSIVQINNPAPLSDSNFGCSVDAINDINGDDIADVIVGDRGLDRTYVFSGADQAIIHTIDDPDSLSGYWFGYEVKNIGDMNGDGIEDIAVGAPGDFTSSSGLRDGPGDCLGLESDPPPECEAPGGRAFIFSGDTGALLLRITGFCGRRAGASLAPLGDISSDGVPDIAVGEPILDIYTEGAVSGASGNDGSNLWCAREAETPGIACFGYRMTEIDDVTGDGYKDLLVGAPHTSTELYASVGMAYVVSGQDGSIYRTHESPTMKEWGNFGDEVATVGDQNMDGIEDYAIGEPINIGEPGIASLHIYSGRTGALINSIESPTAANNDQFGSSIARVEDKDGDNLDDFWVAAPQGRAVYLMNRHGDVIFQIDDQNVKSLSSAHLDDDNNLDLIIATINGAGAIYLVIGGSFIEPDVFDDGDEDTPDTTKTWPIERNDGIELIYTATPLELTHINENIEYEQLNFDTENDIDFFKIKFPPVQNILCNGTDRFIVTVSTPNEIPIVNLYEPADFNTLPFPIWNEVDPISERWATYRNGFIQVILERPRNLSVFTDDDEIVFSVEPADGIKMYDLNVRYECEPHAIVPTPSFNLKIEYIDIFNIHDVDRAYGTIPFDPGQFTDCEEFPQLCDDLPNEYVAFEWDGSPFEMVFHHSTPSSPSQAFSVSLLDQEGKILSSAMPKQFFADHGGMDANVEVQELSFQSMLSQGTTNIENEMILTTENIDKEWYYLSISGSFPTLYSYKLGDYDQDNVGSLSDNCFDTYNPSQADQDADGIGDVCDICPYDIENDSDEDGYCMSTNDCDDHNANIYNGAPEICDNEDNDCDGLVDEGFVFSGFKPPLMMDELKTFKLNSTIPIKFVLTNCQGENIADNTATLALYKLSINGFDKLQVESAGNSNFGDRFRYSNESMLHIYNLKTENLTEGLYRISIIFDSNTKTYSNFFHLN